MLTSVGMASAPISLAARSSFVRSRPQMATRPPREIRRRAVSSPIPELPPVTSAFANSIFMAGHSTTRCPGCGAVNLETLASREVVAEEIELRRAFFRQRIDGRIARPEGKDTLDVFHGDGGEIAICRACEILVRREETPPPAFEDDSYEPFVMERMLRAHIDAYRRKEMLYRSLLP